MSRDLVSLSTLFFFFSSRRRHTRLQGDWSSDVCSSDLNGGVDPAVLTFTGTFPGPYSASIPLDGSQSVGPSGVTLAYSWSLVSQPAGRSEERRVGKECRSRWSPYH